MDVLHLCNSRPQGLMYASLIAEKVIYGAFFFFLIHLFYFCNAQAKSLKQHERKMHRKIQSVNGG